MSDPVRVHVGANIFFEAKLKECEAAYLSGDAQRINAAEENCRSALTGLFDAKRAFINVLIELHRPKT